MSEISTEVAKVVGNKGLNLLINNAGVATKFTKLHLVKAEQLLENLTVNTIAPIILSKVSITFHKYHKQTRPILFLNFTHYNIFLSVVDSSPAVKTSS